MGSVLLLVEQNCNAIPRVTMHTSMYLSMFDFNFQRKTCTTSKVVFVWTIYRGVFSLFIFLHTLSLFLFVSLSPHAIYLVCFLSIFLGCFFLLHVLFNRWKAAFCIHFTILLVQCSFHMLHSSRNFYKHLWIYSSNILNSLNHF